jgi:hypothetical protein
MTGTPAAARAVAIAVKTPARLLAEREVGGFALRGLSLGTREGGANQPPVDRPVLFAFGGLRRRLVGIIREVGRGGVVGRERGFGRLVGGVVGRGDGRRGSQSGI